jgi:hypothetical protein
MCGRMKKNKCKGRKGKCTGRKGNVCKGRGNKRCKEGDRRMKGNSKKNLLVNFKAKSNTKNNLEDLPS